MAYTQRQHQAITFSSSQTSVTCNNVAISSSDTTINYIKVTFPSAGTAKFNFLAIGLETYTSISARISTSTSSFSDSIGFPTSYIASGSTSVSTSTTTVVNNINISSAGTYYFYFKTSSTYADVTPSIQFTASSGQQWTDDGYTDLGTISSTYPHVISNVSQYKIYCFKVDIPLGGTLTFKHEYDGNRVQINTSSYYYSGFYNATTGQLGVSPATGLTPEVTTAIGSSGETLYLWIRNNDGSDTTNITFTVIPPGVNWEKHRFDSGSTTLVTDVDDQIWQVYSGDIRAKSIYYIPLEFSPSGSYEFTSTHTSDVLNAYLTTSNNIEPSTGEPSGQILASDTSSSSGFYFTYSNLVAGTTYYLMFRNRGTGTNSDSFHIGVGWADSYPTWTYSATSSSITVSVNNSANYWLSYWIKDIDNNVVIFNGQTDGRTQNASPTFSNLSPDTHYRIAVSAYLDSYGGTERVLYSTGGNATEDVYTTLQWSYTSESLITVSSSNIPSPQSYNLSYKTGRLFSFKFNQQGTLTVYSSNPQGGLISYFGLNNNSYNSSTGQPYSVYDSETGAFSYSYTRNQNEYCYLWVTTSSETSGFTLNIDFVATPPVIVTPSFSCAASGNSITFTVTNTQDYPYLRYYVRLNNTQIHDSESIYGRFITTNPYTISNLSYNTTYTVNVQYANVANPNLTTERAWVYTSNPPTVTTGAAPQPTTGYVYIYTGSTWVKAKLYIFDGSSWRPASPYIFNGSTWKPTIE